MKKSFKLQAVAIMLYVAFMILYVSCDKVAVLPQVCAECTELNSGLVAPSFCGTPQEVTIYVKLLKDTEGTNWVCKIK